MRMCVAAVECENFCAMAQWINGFVGWFVDGFISIDGTRFRCILIDLPTQGNPQNQIDPIFFLLPFTSLLSSFLSPQT